MDQALCWGLSLVCLIYLPCGVVRLASSYVLEELKLRECN